MSRYKWEFKATFYQFLKIDPSLQFNLLQSMFNGRTIYIQQDITVSSSRSNVINSASLWMSICSLKWSSSASERQVAQLICPYSSGEVNSWYGTPALQFSLDDQIWCVLHQKTKCITYESGFPTLISLYQSFISRKLTNQLVKVWRKLR